MRGQNCEDGRSVESPASECMDRSSFEPEKGDS
jgi:hypothetical protein